MDLYLWLIVIVLSLLAGGVTAVVHSDDPDVQMCRPDATAEQIPHGFARCELETGKVIYLRRVK